MPAEMIHGFIDFHCMEILLKKEIPNIIIVKDNRPPEPSYEHLYKTVCFYKFQLGHLREIFAVREYKRVGKVGYCLTPQDFDRLKKLSVSSTIRELIQKKCRIHNRD